MPDQPVDDAYLENIDQSPGVYNAEIFRTAPFAQHTADAKDVVRQLRDAYNSGNPDAVQAVRNYEMQHFQQGHTNDEVGRRMALADMRDFGSGDQMGRNRAWDLFYQAHQRYIGSALAREDPMSPEDQKALEDHQGFDMEGRPVFDFDPLIRKGIIKPRNVPDYVPTPEPQRNVVDFDKLFKSGR